MRQKNQYKIMIKLECELILNFNLFIINLILQIY